MIFTKTEISDFIRDGFVMLSDGFSPDIAADGREFIWNRLDASPNDRSTWTEPLIHIQEAFNDSPFDKILNPRIATAANELAGESRAELHGFFGWWPVLFPGFQGPGGWHVDGQHFRHRLNSKEQALVTLYLFSDIELGDGGTAIARGSHHEIARLLANAEPEGLAFEDLMQQLPKINPESVTEITGKAGDVAFLHPFLIHGFSANRGSSVRFACNPQYSLKEAMNFDRGDGAHSPVEEAIRVALGKASGP